MVVLNKNYLTDPVILSKKFNFTPVTVYKG